MGGIIFSKKTTFLAATTTKGKDPIEEVSFEVADATETLGNATKWKTESSNDFVIFHDSPMDLRGTKQNHAKMQWTRYEGLSLALEK